MAIENAQATEQTFRVLAGRRPEKHREDWVWALGALADAKLDGGNSAGTGSLVTQASEQVALRAQSRERALAERAGWLHRLRAPARLACGNASDALVEASVALEIQSRRLRSASCH